MKRTYRSGAVALAALMALIFWFATGVAQDPPGEEAAGLDEVAQHQEPSFFVHAEFAGSLGEYQEGDTLTLRVRSEEDAYLYILYQQADGKVFQIFPNSSQKDNRVKAKQTVQVPEQDDLFRWRIGPPFGKEVIKVIASRSELNDLSDPKLRRARFNPIEMKTVLAAADTLEKGNAADWAEVDLEVKTYPRDETPGAPGARRWGVFFGVSEYMLDPILREATDGERKFNLSGCHTDIQKLADVFVDEGGLRGHKVYLNQEATRANMEEAITKWLPSVSRPGDTIVIAFSGHGGQIPDNNGDEEDGMDEILCTYDYMNASILELYRRKIQQRGSVTPNEREVISRAEAALRRSGGRNQYGEIERATGVDDDVFGHWLQKLAGRQVLVILDACRSGGFATDTKSLVPEVKVGTFDFLDGETTRLKDIGQPEQALLAASKAWQDSQELNFDSGWSGAMTFSFFRALEQLNGPVTIEQAYEYCQGFMQEMFAYINEQRQQDGKDPIDVHEPHMKNYCTRPLVIKP